MVECPPPETVCDKFMIRRFCLAGLKKLLISKPSPDPVVQVEHITEIFRLASVEDIVDKDYSVMNSKLVATGTGEHVLEYTSLTYSQLWQLYFEQFAKILSDTSHIHPRERLSKQVYS